MRIQIFFFILKNKSFSKKEKEKLNEKKGQTQVSMGQTVMFFIFLKVNNNII